VRLAKRGAVLSPSSARRRDHNPSAPIRAAPLQSVSARLALPCRMAEGWTIDGFRRSASPSATRIPVALGEG